MKSKTSFLHHRLRFINREGIIALIIWMGILLLLWRGQSDSNTIIGWCILVPYSIGFYWYSFHSLIPRALKKEKPYRYYLWKSALTLALSSIPVFIFCFAYTRDDGDAIGYYLLNVAFQIFIAIPIIWKLYKWKQQGAEEVEELQKELRQSTANMDFLRSQINPHFLFNALNTIYGTALQEKAERTSEGIEKLADMMRFMLEENMQEKISLSREIEYLNNYIALLKLRTDTLPGISIQTEIEAKETYIQIAPMLLIPFVENAFKHGVSFREPSQIKATLEIKGKTLYFDVYNTRHQRGENDPEKSNTGIGLENVAQRLKLLYPNRHELNIRETTKEFFVHLTIQLD